MNSEELELSLKTEFEHYLNGLVAEMRRNISDFQEKFDAEFEKHKAQMDEAFRDLDARFEINPEFDQPFRETIMDHLRLARDDGAQVAATAFGEAEKMAAETALPAPEANYDLIRDAVNEISAERTQSGILQTLIRHVGEFAPRGAFFIVRNEHLIGWNVFGGSDTDSEHESVQEIRIPITADTLLGKAVFGLRTAENNADSGLNNRDFLQPLGFGDTEAAVSIPLVVRGRSVAVLYAQSVADDYPIRTDVLETLVRVAALTVELRAETQQSKSVREAFASSTEEKPESAAEFTENVNAEPYATNVSDETANFHEPAEVPSVTEAAETVEAEFVQESAYEGAIAVETDEFADDEIADFEPKEIPAEPEEQISGETGYELNVDDENIVHEAYSGADIELQSVETDAVTEVETVEFEPDAVGQEEPITEAEEIIEADSSTEFAFASNDVFDASDVETESEKVSEDPEFSIQTGNGKVNGGSVPEPVVEIAAPQPIRSRFGDRNVDLPIEVAEDERRLHNDARRFARLLVSEIKLYNEQTVIEGREANDLYQRLREAIDRSREMYDKRVQPAVSSKFDYFHYELVNGLADGQASRLGAEYNGATV